MNLSRQDNPNNQDNLSKVLNKREKITKASKLSNLSLGKWKNVAEEDLQKITFKNAQENRRKRRNWTKLKNVGFSFQIWKSSRISVGICKNVRPSARMKAFLR